jgi:hypothetical protein
VPVAHGQRRSIGTKIRQDLIGAASIPKFYFGRREVELRGTKKRANPPQIRVIR